METLRSESKLSLLKNLQASRENLLQLKTYCSCCLRMLVCKNDSNEWQCWFCDITNRSSWRCLREHNDLHAFQQCAIRAEQKAFDEFVEKRNIVLLDRIPNWNQYLVKNKKAIFSKDTCMNEIHFDPKEKKWNIIASRCTCLHSDCALLKLNSCIRGDYGPNIEYLEALGLLGFGLEFCVVIIQKIL
jgi:hypothetical protein